MPITTTWTPYGAAAHAALVAAVRSAKCGDALRAVTVVVPSELVGVAARRALARGDGRPGVAALSVVTMRRLAEALGTPTMTAGGRRPLTATVLAGTVRGLLRDDPGIFAPVAGHIGTVRALAGAHRALRTVAEPDLQALGAGERVVAETVRLHRALTARCALTSYDEADLLRAATGVAQKVTDAVVVFLPGELDAAEQALLDALGAVTAVHLVRGATGDPVADGRPGPGAPPLASRVLHASDPDDEVRAVVREVMAALRDGVPGHRIAVFYGSADPYARLLHEHLDQAGVTFFGRGVRSALDGRFGRGLLRALALPDHGFRRDEVLAWITDAPVRHRGVSVHSSPWERVSRAAGVVGERDWVRLSGFAERRREHADAERAAAEPRQWLVDRDEREADAALQLLDFVEDLTTRFDLMEKATTWRELGGEAMRLWTDLLGGDDVTRWPEEIRAASRIRAALQAVTDLGADAGPPEPALLRELLELQLADDVDRVGEAGIGVHVGPVSDGIGTECDRVFVLGAAEGTLPARLSDDPLLPDRVRHRSGGELPTLGEQVRRRHHRFLAALAAAPPEGRVVTFPRGDLRAGGPRVPSRWLLPSLRALSGIEDLTITRWQEATGIVELPSYAGALARTPVPATAQEWRQRVAADAAGVPLPPDLGPGGDAVTLGRATRAARRATAFTAHHGNLAGETLPDPTSGTPVSVTALQTWVGCPDDYFLRYLLRVAPVVQPEEIVRISALDRGTVLHDVLEQLVRRAEAEGWAPGFDDPWPARAADELNRIADERFARAEREGMTGSALMWEQDREALRADLHAWLRHDDERRAEHDGLVPVAVEWAFGHQGAPPAELDLGDGRVLRLRGTIDRIDRGRDGRLVVTDYKSGSARDYSTLTQQTPCDAGRRLQLPIYALAARAAHAADVATPVSSHYWFTSRRGGFVRIGYDVDDGVTTTATRVVRAIVDGITLGVFPGRPGRRDRQVPGRRSGVNRCHACDPDGLGETSSSVGWALLAGADELGDPALHAVRELLFGAQVQP